MNGLPPFSCAPGSVSGTPLVRETGSAARPWNRTQGLSALSSEPGPRAPMPHSSRLVQLVLAFAVSFLLFVPLDAQTVPGRYIVELTGDPVAAHAERVSARADRRFDMQGPAARARRQALRLEQRAVRDAAASQQVEVVGSLESLSNALIVRVADANAAALERLPGVRKVHPVRLFHMSLDRALQLHKVPEAWSQVGVDHAGEGVKIAIIDSGIDIAHPGFKDASLKPPDGFPKVNAEDDVKFTNGKVIVARSYVSMFSTPDPDETPRDHFGHGTATAMAAAGVFNTGPLASITGVAPKAYLGSYKVFGSPGVNDSAQTDMVLKAIDDAVSDGMDVINLSLGSILAQRPEEDIQVRALERASALGVIVVVAVGNDGNHPNTIGTPGTGPSIITVGASRNDRVFAASAIVEGQQPKIAIPGSGPNSAIDISAPLRDVSTIDGDGLGCSAFAADSLKGRIAFILRGTCTFEEKLNNVTSGGAVAALVYTDATRPQPIGMDVRAAKLPALMVSHSDGLDIRKQLASASNSSATLRFTIAPLFTSAEGLAGFSGVGPTVTGAIKPDLVAVGTNFYTAAQANNPEGILFDLLGYTLTQGTSFSSPLVAGAAAVLKSARKGLTSAQYRSLLVNYAAPFSGARVQESGAGGLDLGAALRGTVALAPVSLSFGSGPEADVTRSLTLSNVGATQETFQLSFAPRGGTPPPQVTVQTVQLAAGASSEVRVRFAAPNSGSGVYEGYLRVSGLTSGVEARVPYWYAVPSTTAKYISVLDSRDRARRAAVVNRAILFRVTDPAGVPLKEPDTKIVATTGNGELLRIDSLDSRYPGVWAASVRLGPEAGVNVFEIKVGDVTTQVVIVGQ